MQFCFRKSVSSSLWFCKPFAFHWAILRNLVVLIALVYQYCEHVQYHAIVLEQLIEQFFEFVYMFRQYGGCVFDLVCAASGHICVASWLQVATRLHVVVVCVGMCWVATRMRVVVYRRRPVCYLRNIFTYTVLYFIIIFYKQFTNRQEHQTHTDDIHMRPHTA